MGERWSPLDEAKAAAARERAEQLKNGPPPRRTDRRRQAAGGAPASRRSRAGRIGATALVVVGLAVGRAVVDEHWGPSANSLSGRCVTLTGTEPHRELSEIRCGWEHSGKVIAVIPMSGSCPAGTDTTFVLKYEKDHTLCIDRDL